MKNSEVWEVYKDYTKDITELSRKLAFAGVAIVWVLKPEEGAFGTVCLLSLILIVGYFLADISQYLTAAFRWYRWINKKEEEIYHATGDIEGDYSPSTELDIPVRYLFWIKVVLLLLGFLLIGVEIVSRFA